MTAASIVLDVSIKMGIVGLLAWLATRRAGLGEARGAHAVWLSTVAAFTVAPILAVAVAPAVLAVPSAGVRGLVPEASADVLNWVLWVYLAVAAVLVLRVAAGLAGVRRIFARGIVIDVGDPDPLAASLAGLCAAGVATLLETAMLSVPATAGFLRPRVLLPHGWREMDERAVRAAVGHELAHVARWDYLAIVMADLVRAVWWFHPVAWLATDQVRWFAELACDAAAATGAEHETYARALLQVAAHSRSPERLRPSFVLTATSGLTRRIELLLDRSPARAGHAPAPVIAMLALVLLPALMFIRFGPIAASAAAPFAARHALRHAAHSHAH